MNVMSVANEPSNSLHAQTLPRAFAERHEIFAQLRRVRLQPALGVKNLTVGEMLRVVVHHDGCHAYRRLCIQSGLHECQKGFILFGC